MRDKHKHWELVRRRFGGEVPKVEAGTDDPQPDEDEDLDEELDDEVGQPATGEDADEAEDPQRQE